MLREVIKKIKLPILWNMEEARLWSYATLLHLPQGVLYLFRVWWNLKMIKEFWREMCCLVSESLVLVTGHGFSNRITTQNTQLKSTQECLTAKHWTILNWPETSPDLNPAERLWRELKHGVQRGRPSNLTQLEQFVHEDWVTTPVDRFRSLIDNYKICLIAVITSNDWATKKY